jgi:hypothetical protein
MAYHMIAIQYDGLCRVEMEVSRKFKSRQALVKVFDNGTQAVAPHFIDELRRLKGKVTEAGAGIFFEKWYKKGIVQIILSWDLEFEEEIKSLGYELREIFTKPTSATNIEEADVIKHGCGEMMSFYNRADMYSVADFFLI